MTGRLVSPMQGAAAFSRASRWSFRRSTLALVFLSLLGACVSEGSTQGRGPTFGKEVLHIATGAGAYDLAWSPDQKSLVGVLERSLVAWNLSDGSVRWKIPFVRQLGGGGRIGFLDGGARIVVHYSKAQTILDKSNHGYALTIVDAQSGRVIQDVQFTQGNPSAPDRPVPANRAGAFDISEDGHTIALALNILGPVVIADTGSWREILRSPSSEAVAFMAFDERRDRLILARKSGNGRIQTWRLSSKSKIADFTTYKTGLSRMAVDRSTGVVFTGGDGDLYPVRPPTPGQPATFEGTEDDPNTLVRAWDPANGNLLRTYLGPGRKVRGLSLSPNGKYIVAAKSRSLHEQADAYVLAWEVASGRLLAATSYGQGFPDAVAFSPGGERIAISSDQGLKVLLLDPQLFP